MGTSSALSSLLSGSNSADAIDLSTILEAATGSSSSGIDVTAAVNAGVAAAQAPEDTWESQETLLSNQDAALTQIQTDSTTLDQDVQSLNSLVGSLNTNTVTSSSPTVATATVSAGAATGTTVVEVNSLATTASYASSAVTDATTDLGTGSITITPAGGTATTITTGSGVDTLSDLETAINAAGAGVTASIVTDSTGSRLALVSNTSGSAGGFTVTSSGSLGFTAGATGSNASLTVNGITISSASNTVTGAIPDVTLNLLNASPGTQVSLTVAPDTTAASTAINQFVTDYNTLIGDVNKQFAYTTGTGQGVLAQDPTTQTLQGALLGSLGYTTTIGTGTNTSVASLASLGITVNTDGTMSVDSSTLSNTLDNNFSEVQSFFQGSALNGFANSMDQMLSTYTDATDGAFTVDIQSMKAEYTGLQTDISNFESNVITPLRAQLQSEYSKAEIALQQLPMELKDVDAELGLNNSSNG